MPYWSSSRVGVVVDGPPAAKARSARKGITMEDLKKQTALRLAQEQGRTGETPVAEPAPVRSRQSPRGKGGRHGPSSNNSFSQNRGGRTTPDRHNNSHAARSPPAQTRSFPSLADHRQPPPNVPQLQRSFHGSEHSLNPSHHSRPAPPSHSLSASRSVDSAAEKGSNSKLPHGLTVHELKEMTKARLAAERGVAPAVPSTVQVSSTDMMHQHPQARSPFPGETAEAWETASVSTSASDYPASLNGTASFNGDETIPFARSSSYPNANNNNNNNPGGINSNEWSEQYQMPLATDNYAPNRRRAATLSPRPGLVQLHEHRRVLPPPSIPMDMHSGSGGPLGRPQQSFPQQAPPPSSDYYPQRYADVGGNRARTSSAVSLPSISHTAEEFGGQPPPIRFSSQFDSVREDAAVTGLSDVFRGSGDCSSPAFDDFGGCTTATTSATSTLQGFNGTPSSSSMGLGSTSFGGSRMRAATATGSSDYLCMGSGSSSTDLMMEQQDLRHRAATWSEPTLDMFCGQDLSEDLASILKLSGAEQKDDLP